MTIPNGAVGVLATDNNDPLQYKGTTSRYLLYDIHIDSDTLMTAAPESALSLTAGLYLGGITSADGSVVYWVNDRKPLP